MAVLWFSVCAAEKAEGVMRDIVSRLKEFVENEMRSCSMDYGGITPIYVYRMWGGTVKIYKIKAGLALIRAER